MKLKITLFLVLFLFSASVFAQELGTVSSDSEIDKGIMSEASNEIKSDDAGGALETEYDVYIGEASPEIHSAVKDLTVKLPEIFSEKMPENLKINSAIQDEMVVYSLEAVESGKQIFSEDKYIFDLRVDKPVEFKLIDNKIIVNNEQIIDYKEIVRENEVMPVELEIYSEEKPYDLTVIPNPDSAEFRFICREKEVMMPVYPDFKVEDKKLNVLHNGQIYDLRVNPPEAYGAIHDLSVEEPRVVIKDFSLGIENEKPVYDLRVEEPARVLWIFPTIVENRYLIDPTDGTVQIVDSPWYVTSETVGMNYGEITWTYKK